MYRIVALQTAITELWTTIKFHSIKVGWYSGCCTGGFPKSAIVILLCGAPAFVRSEDFFLAIALARDTEDADYSSADRPRRRSADSHFALVFV